MTTGTITGMITTMMVATPPKELIIATNLREETREVTGEVEATTGCPKDKATQITKRNPLTKISNSFTTSNYKRRAKSNKDMEI